MLALASRFRGDAYCSDGKLSRLAPLRRALDMQIENCASLPLSKRKRLVCHRSTHSFRVLPLPYPQRHSAFALAIGAA